MLDNKKLYLKNEDFLKDLDEFQKEKIDSISYSSIINGLSIEESEKEFYHSKSFFSRSRNRFDGDQDYTSSKRNNIIFHGHKQDLQEMERDFLVGKNISCNLYYKSKEDADKISEDIIDDLKDIIEKYKEKFMKNYKNISIIGHYDFFERKKKDFFDAKERIDKRIKEIGIKKFLSGNYELIDILTDYFLGFMYTSGEGIDLGMLDYDESFFFCKSETDHYGENCVIKDENEKKLDLQLYKKIILYVAFLRYEDEEYKSITQYVDLLKNIDGFEGDIGAYNSFENILYIKEKDFKYKLLKEYEQEYTIGKNIRASFNCLLSDIHKIIDSNGLERDLDMENICEIKLELVLRYKGKVIGTTKNFMQIKSPEVEKNKSKIIGDSKIDCGNGVFGRGKIYNVLNYSEEVEEILDIYSNLKSTFFQECLISFKEKLDLIDSLFRRKTFLSLCMKKTGLKDKKFKEKIFIITNKYSKVFKHVEDISDLVLHFVNEETFLRLKNVEDNNRHLYVIGERDNNYVVSGKFHNFLKSFESLLSINAGGKKSKLFKDKELLRDLVKIKSLTNIDISELNKIREDFGIENFLNDTFEKIGDEDIDLIRFIDSFRKNIDKSINMYVKHGSIFEIDLELHNEFMNSKSIEELELFMLKMKEIFKKSYQSGKGKRKINY